MTTRSEVPEAAAMWGNALASAMLKARLDRAAIANNTRTSDKTVRSWERGSALPTRPEYQRLTLSIPAMRHHPPPWQPETDQEPEPIVVPARPLPVAVAVTVQAPAPPPPPVDDDPVLTAALAYTDARHALDAADALVAAATEHFHEAQRAVESARGARDEAEKAERAALARLSRRGS